MTDFEMYLMGNEDGDVELICEHPRCMRESEPTKCNPSGLWLQDVGNIPFKANPSEVAEKWAAHLRSAHPETLS